MPIHARDEIDISSRGEWSKKIALSPAQTQGRQDALFHGQGRSQFGARSVLTVREHGKLARTPLAAFFNIPLKHVNRIDIDPELNPLRRFVGFQLI